MKRRQKGQKDDTLCGENRHQSCIVCRSLAFFRSRNARTFTLWRILNNTVYETLVDCFVYVYDALNVLQLPMADDKDRGTPNPSFLWSIGARFCRLKTSFLGETGTKRSSVYVRLKRVLFALRSCNFLKEKNGPCACASNFAYSVKMIFDKPRVLGALKVARYYCPFCRSSVPFSVKFDSSFC